MHELEIEFEIYHQHEANDPVPSVGRHLGSANHPNEAVFLLQHLTFTSDIYTRLPDAKTPVIAQATTVHATPFLEGREGIDFTKQSSDPFKLALMEDCENVRGLPQEEALKKGKEVRRKKWQFPLAPPTANWFRSHPLFYYLAYTVSGSNWIRHDSRMVPHLDKEGILFVEDSLS